MSKELTREHILLRAAYQLLRKQDESSYVLNICEQSTVYDGADCDGCCLMEDIGDILDENGVDKEEMDH